jgi:hypothetical protein
MKKKHLFTLLLAICLMGLQSCAQGMCAAYTQVDDNKEKKEKKEGRF